MTLHMRIEKLTQKIAEKCREIDRKSIERFIDTTVKAKRIFIEGAGRSGLVAKAFAMRLMHLGFTVYVVGEVVTPAVEKGDVLLVVSGSGSTLSAYNTAKTAKERGLKIAVLTSYPNSLLGKLADVTVQIKGRELDDKKRDYESRQLVGDHEPVTPLGTLFELSTIVFLDSIVEELMLRLKKSEAEMRKHHANL